VALDIFKIFTPILGRFPFWVEVSPTTKVVVSNSSKTCSERGENHLEKPLKRQHLFGDFGEDSHFDEHIFQKG